MGYVHQTIIHELGVMIKVEESDNDSLSEPWKIISVEFDDMESITPRELIILGRWLIYQGMRIRREFKSNGAPREIDI